MLGIERGDAAAAFGEAALLLDPSHREGGRAPLDVVLPLSAERFGLPDNLHVIATRDLCGPPLDASHLRQRFCCETVDPDPATLEGAGGGTIENGGLDLRRWLSTLNERLAWLAGSRSVLGQGALAHVDSLAALVATYRSVVLPHVVDVLDNDRDRLLATLGPGLVRTDPFAGASPLHPAATSAGGGQSWRLEATPTLGSRSAPTAQPYWPLRQDFLTPHKICRYGVNSGVFTYLDIDNHDLGAFLINEVVDWARGKIYIASGAPYGIEVVSVDTLNNLGMYPMEAYATCVAMSIDGRYVFGGHDGVYAGAIWMFNATDGSLMGNMAIEPGIRNLAIAHDLRSAYVGSPVQRKMLTPSIELLYPSWHNVYGYTPTQFLVRFKNNLGEYDAYNATFEVNGANLSLTPYDTDGHWVYYQANFSQTLADGAHNVSISLRWLDQLVWGNSTFTVNRSSPDSLRPTLTANEPINQTIQLNKSMTISARIVHVNSDRPVDGGWILVNGINLTITFDPEILLADYAMPSLGQQNVSACVYWDDGLGRAWANWTFFVMDGPLMTPIFPAASQVLTEFPDHIEVGIDVRDAGGDLSAPQVYLDGSPLLTILTANNT